MFTPYALLLLLFPLPIGTDRKLRRVPWATLALIFLNFLFFIITHPETRPDMGTDLFLRWGLSPGSGDIIALVTYMFLHVSLQHLFWNMLFLWLFGPAVEEAVGIPCFLLLYFGGGLAAGVLNMSFVEIGGPRSSPPLVGASGAISAILAPFAVRFYRSRIQLIWLPGLVIGSFLWVQVPSLAGVSLWLVETAVGTVRSYTVQQSGETAYWAHVGGFVFGLFAAEIIGLLRRGQQEYLLEDARAASDRGHVLIGTARQCYQAFLRSDPGNIAVRTEYAGILVREVAEHGGARSADYVFAQQECRGVVRALLDRNRLAEAYACFDNARKNGVMLNTLPEERLKLARAAEDAGNAQTGRLLLRSIIWEYPGSLEEEVARLRLGQMLVTTAPAEAADMLRKFLDRYPQSQWRVLAAQLREDALRRCAADVAGGEANPA
jgi:membrane associated rhomboid family serine protease